MRECKLAESKVNNKVPEERVGKLHMKEEDLANSDVAVNNACMLGVVDLDGKGR